MLLEIIILAVLQPFAEDFDGIAIIAVLCHVLYSTLILLSHQYKFKFLFLFAFLVRVVFMFLDLYVFRLPHSGGDSEFFFIDAVLYSQDLFNMPSGELYSKVMAVLFYIIGPQRPIGQYVNVLLGLSVVFIIYRILIILEVNSKITRLVVTIAAFFPTSLFMSAIFLREAFPTFFIAASVFYFIKWFQSGRIMDMLLSFLSVGLASTFHAGVIGVVFGYAFVFIFYKLNSNSYKFTLKSLMIFLLICMIFFVGYTSFSDVLLKKLNHVGEIGDIYSAANYREGGSAYLENLTITNPLELTLYGPIKCFFFLTMPLPIYWRGLMDILTFIFDSSLYLGAIVYFVIYRKKFNKRKKLVIGLLLALLGSVLIFGVGVTNAGTAVRHRQKLVPIVLVTLAVMIDGVSSTIQRRPIPESRSSNRARR